MRTLFSVPILHTDADLGSLAPAVAARRLDPGEREDRRQLVLELWAGIRERVLTLDLDWRVTLVYQDGLPVCGREMDIARELSERGSPNHALLLDLARRGATLVGTEDPALLLRELAMARRLAGTGDDLERRSAIESIREEMAATLAARDAFVARRIGETLGPAAPGILFLGALHRVEDRLPKDVVVRHLAYRLAPEGGGA